MYPRVKIVPERSLGAEVLDDNGITTLSHFTMYVVNLSDKMDMWIIFLEQDK